MKRQKSAGAIGAWIFALLTLLFITLAPHATDSSAAGSHPDAAAKALQSIGRR